MCRATQAAKRLVIEWETGLGMHPESVFMYEYRCYTGEQISWTNSAFYLILLRFRSLFVPQRGSQALRTHPSPGHEVHVRQNDLDRLPGAGGVETGSHPSEELRSEIDGTRRAVARMIPKTYNFCLHPVSFIIYFTL